MHALHPVAAKAVEFLRKGTPGDRFTENDLSLKLAVECGPSSEGKKRICRAIKVCIREHHVLWKWNRPKEGEASLVCCDASQVMEVLNTERKRMYRNATRLGRKSMCLDESKLSAEDSKRYRAMQVVATMSGNLNKTQTLPTLVKEGSALVAPDESKILALMSK